jgi:hypothetical protein
MGTTSKHALRCSKHKASLPCFACPTQARLSQHTLCVMRPTMVAATKNTQKPAAKVAKLPPRAFRLGYAAGVIRVKAGVDLTKPTAPEKKAA